jgi:uncharacterized membrane protein YeaQ/YmgE (transglycosylase-associated protein family)
MSLELLCVWIVIGMIAAWVTSAAVTGPFGRLGDLLVGVLGAFLGGLLDKAFHMATPFGGIAGMIFVAFAGACMLLLALRVTFHLSGRRALQRS